MTGSLDERRPRPKAWVFGAIAVAIASAAVGFGLAGAEAAASALLGAGVAVTVQGVAFWLLVRRRDAGMVDFLEAFLRASIARLFGGVVLVWTVFALGAAEPLAFLAGFGGGYAALEVLTNVELARRRTDG
ncbi:MAG: hypothetical protein ACF8XB_12995 [Planctomycetota bacterium JB042]